MRAHVIMVICNILLQSLFTAIPVECHVGKEKFYDAMPKKNPPANPVARTTLSDAKSFTCGEKKHFVNTLIFVNICIWD